jgi:hypothetical protein
LESAFSSLQSYDELFQKPTNFKRTIRMQLPEQHARVALIIPAPASTTWDVDVVAPAMQQRFKIMCQHAATFSNAHTNLFYTKNILVLLSGTGTLVRRR